jgi:hypothetical protein
MHADVFITLAFAGLVVVVALVSLLLVVPRARRESAAVRHREEGGRL